MIQKEMLQYQALDGELIRLEKELKKNENFVQRKRYKAMHQECEDNLNKLDARAGELRTLLANAKQTLANITAIVEEYEKEIEDINDVDELNYMSKKLAEQTEALANAEREVKKILQEGEELAKSFENINAQLPKIVEGYKKSNEAFEKDAAEMKPRIVELKKQQAELKKAIDAELMAIYAKLSEGQKIHPVFVPLMDGNRCGGCRMDMPTAVVSARMAEKGYVVCEHCGRIIYSE